MPKKKPGTKARRGSKAKSSPMRAVAALAPQDATIDNLAKIEHIVVLMMENRSFDHMLGYLSLTGAMNVDGLRTGMTNPLSGKPPVPIGRVTKPNICPDPCHTAACVDQQVANNNNGFAQNYASQGGNPADIMGYYDAESVPVYDFLARHYVVCDKWFSSVPGATWPNRLYAMTGQAPRRDNQKLPIYYLPSFVRHLDDNDVSWRWYAHEKLLIGPVGTIDCADGAYETAKNVYFFDPHFFDDARKGALTAVSWVDPNFVDMGGLQGANDDHPCADIRDGQALVHSVVQALSNSPVWPKTLLIITYDEHGGFFDHVPPGSAAGAKPFDRYGVRVPAIIVSPWVEQGRVDSTIFDHTSIIKTILLRFCRDAAGNTPDMGPRVAAANHLGPLLSQASARPAVAAPAVEPVTAKVSDWMEDIHALRVDAIAAPKPPARSDFQQGWLRARAQLEQRRLRQLAKAPPRRKKGK